MISQLIKRAPHSSLHKNLDSLAHRSGVSSTSDTVPRLGPVIACPLVGRWLARETLHMCAILTSFMRACQIRSISGGDNALEDPLGLSEVTNWIINVHSLVGSSISLSHYRTNGESPTLTSSSNDGPVALLGQVAGLLDALIALATSGQAQHSGILGLCDHRY